MHYSSLHTHSTFSDGKSTMEEQVRSAIEKGLTTIGFSDHSYTDFDLSYCMKKEQIPDYLRHIHELSVQYADKIEILTGLELDGYSSLFENTPASCTNSPYDYIIGSVHYIHTDDGLYHPVDSNQEGMIRLTEQYFGGDYLAMAKKYLQDSVHCTYKNLPDIVGHFDLATKFNLVDESDASYQKVLLECAAAVLQICPIFEINTGAIARGYRQTPYPHVNCIRYIHEHGGKFVLTSDCHDARFLDCHYAESVALARSCGVRSLVRLTKHGWIEESID